MQIIPFKLLQAWVMFYALTLVCHVTQAATLGIYVDRIDGDVGNWDYIGGGATDRKCLHLNHHTFW